MKEKVLAVYSKKEYTDKFIEYISEKKEFPLLTIAFTEKEKLLQYIEDNEIFLLLTDPGAIEDEIKNKNIQKIMMLSSGIVSPTDRKYMNVYKYQSVEKILQKILEYYAEQMDKDEVPVLPEKECQIVGVYSPAGGAGKTTLALTLGQILAQTHPTLYINFEEYSAFEKIFQRKYEENLSDLMYYFQQDSHSVSVRLQMIACNLGTLNYIPPVTYAQDLRKQKTEEWIKLIYHIQTVTSYEKIVLDLGNMLSDVNQMMEICDVIYVPIQENKIAGMKIKTWEEYLGNSGKENLLRKLQKVKMKQQIMEKEGDDYYEQQLLGETGKEIRRIVIESERR